MSADVCTMCDQNRATTTYGFPVCDDCHAWLSSLDGDLKAMEASDPRLAELGRRIEASHSGDGAMNQSMHHGEGKRTDVDPTHARIHTGEKDEAS